MLYVISPAKALDFTSPAAASIAPTEPEFQAQARQLIAVLTAKTPLEVSQLMGLSDKLAALNVARYAAWRAKPAPDAARPAAFAFDGDVYDGLAARTLPADRLAWLQSHARILSGLYGVLRPLDRMQPYRLEMGTRLATDKGDDLYPFWGDRIAKALNAALAAQRKAAGEGQGAGVANDRDAVVVNLASQEYFRAVDRKALRARVVECVFQDEKNGDYKIISFFAKRARGRMLRWAAEHGVDRPEGLKDFDADGYAFCAPASSGDRLVFRRKEKA
jgi:cytoplasmic iron level regulating protein YaaA (DUF328/UPF0246 family)